MSWCQSQTFKTWWWRVLTIIVLVIAVNAFISFLHARLHPSHCTRSTAVPFRLQLANLELLTEPKALYLSVDTPLLPLSDKDLVLRSAYVNPRLETSHGHANSTIILIEIRRSLIEQGAIERCGVGPYSSTQFEVSTICRKFEPLPVALVARLLQHSPCLQSAVGSNPCLLCLCLSIS